MNGPRPASNSVKPPVEPQAASTARRLRSFLITLTILIITTTAIYEAGQAWCRGRDVRRLTAQMRQLEKEREEALSRLAALSARRAPRLPTPPMQPNSQPAGGPAENLPSSLYARFKDKTPKLSAEQVETYLKANGRKASTLLAAYRTSGDTALLHEAMENYPHDPQVAFEAVFAKGLPSEQRRQWLNALEQSAPDNALANYLSARDYLKAGQTDQAIQQLVAAGGKRQFQDYTLSRRQDDEEAYLAAGYTSAEAKMVGGQVELPQLAELKQLGVQMVELSNSYRKAGDEASAQAVLQMAAGLGQRYSAEDCTISHLVGMAIERIALNAMDPTLPYGSSGYTVREQLESLNRQKTAIASLFKQNEGLFEQMSDQDWISYIDREKMFGEEAARLWAIGKYGQK